jgi:rare lipoprotein A (peptidoglycan hydrolase)
MIRIHFYHNQGIRLMAAAMFVIIGGLGSPALAKHKNKRNPYPTPPRSACEEPKESGTTVGKASWYGHDFHGRRTASGETYNMNAMTAAHRSLPFGTCVRVTNLENGQSVIVKINDRGPFIYDRIIDLSYGSAKKIGLCQSGVARVKVELVDENLYLLEIAQQQSQPEDYSFREREELAALVHKAEEPVRPEYTEVGYASLFGRKSPSGDAVNSQELVASHFSLPIGTTVKVTNLENNKTVIVRINHRCDRFLGRVIQLSRAAAQQIDMTPKFMAKVKIETVK